jgi:hypothetical protein
MELLAEGWSMRAACKELGISRSIAHIWKNGTTVRLKDGTAATSTPAAPAPAAQRPSGRLEHLRGTALGFRNLTNYVARSLLETGGFRPQLHRRL